MSLDYSLKIDTLSKPKQLYDDIVKIDGFTGESKDGSFSAEGVFGSVSEESEEEQNETERDFGFRSRVAVWFRPNYSDETRIGDKNMLRAVLVIIRQYIGDVAMTVNNEYVLLKRVNGELILNEESFGDSHEREFDTNGIDMKYKLEKIAMLN